MPSSRHTFVLRVHPGGTSTLEHVSTREQVRVDELADLAGRVRAWLRDADARPSAVPAHPPVPPSGA